MGTILGTGYLGVDYVDSWLIVLFSSDFCSSSFICSMSFPFSIYPILVCVFSYFQGFVLEGGLYFLREDLFSLPLVDLKLLLELLHSVFLPNNIAFEFLDPSLMLYG